KAAVLDLVERKLPNVFRVFSFVSVSRLVDGARVATLNRLSARRVDGRVISYRLAHALRFRDHRGTENLSLIDCYDAAGQVHGRSLVEEGASPPLQLATV